MFLSIYDMKSVWIMISLQITNKPWSGYKLQVDHYGHQIASKPRSRWVLVRGSTLTFVTIWHWPTPFNPQPTNLSYIKVIKENTFWYVSFSLGKDFIILIIKLQNEDKRKYKVNISEKTQNSKVSRKQKIETEMSFWAGDTHTNTEEDHWWGLSSGQSKYWSEAGELRMINWAANIANWERV